MPDATSSTRKSWFQFTLRDCFIASVAVAVTIVPFKLHERFRPASEHVQVRATVYRVDPDKLREHVHDWNEGQFRAVSKEEVAAVENGLKAINAHVVSAPNMMTEYGREVKFFTGMRLPIVERSEEGEELATTTDVGDGFLVKPQMLPNGRIRVDVEMQLMYYRAAEDRPKNQTAPANYIESESGDFRKHPEIGLQKIAFPAELSSGETMFLCDAGNGLFQSGVVIQVQVHKLK